MVEKAVRTSGTVWVLTFFFIYFIGVVLWVTSGAKTNTLESSLLNEREYNSTLTEGFSTSGWGFSQDNQIFQSVTTKLAERIINANPIVDGQEGAVEAVFDDAPYKLLIYGALLDYRLGMLWVLIPTMIFLWMATFIDGYTLRRISTYKNSFSSPLRHTIGGKILGFNTGLLILALFFAPVSIPFWVFIALALTKTFGWWFWAVNLPKRI